MRNLLYLILFYCIYQSSTLDDHLEDFQKTPDEEMDVKPLHQAQMVNPKMRNDNICAGNVSFDAERNTDNHVNVPNQIIIYDKVRANKAGAFNLKTGKFSSPLAGTYFFSFSALPMQGVQTDVVLMKNGTRISNIHSVLAPNTSQLTVQNVILELQRYDSVWVLLEKGTLWSRDGSISFKGFLIYCQFK